MSDTPLTDALDADLNHDIAVIHSLGGSLTERVAHVTANLFKHAKQLERENNELRRFKAAALTLTTQASVELAMSKEKT